MRCSLENKITDCRQWRICPNWIKYFLDYLIPLMHILMVKIHDFRGDLTDILAKPRTLLAASRCADTVPASNPDRGVWVSLARGSDCWAEQHEHHIQAAKRPQSWSILSVIHLSNFRGSWPRTCKLPWQLSDKLGSCQVRWIFSNLYNNPLGYFAPLQYVSCNTSNYCVRWPDEFIRKSIKHSQATTNQLYGVKCPGNRRPIFVIYA